MDTLLKSPIASRSKAKEIGALEIQFGERLRELRNARDLSQRALGDEIGVTFQQVQKYEKGTNRVTVGRLVEICRALSVGYEFFLSPQATPPHEQANVAQPQFQPVTLQLVTADETGLLKAFRNIASSRKRHSILDLIEGMSEKNV